MEHPVLTFFIDYLSNLHIQHLITADMSITLSSLDLGLRDSILNRTDTPSASALHELSANTIYQVTDYYDCKYTFFAFPDKKEILFIGPYLTKDIQDSDIYELMNLLQIPAELFLPLQNYYYSLPHINDKEHFSILLRQLYTTVFASELPTFQHLDLKKFETANEFLEKNQFHVSDDPALSMHLLEKRYRYEDELLDAVSHGNTAKALSITEAVGTLRLAPRTDNELRNQKNLMITLNSLLRRSAYEGGVHSFYIDAVSTNYARLIEQCLHKTELYDITPYMVRSYCDLVNKRSMTSYSKPVRHILVTVDASLTGDLSLKRFADELFLNTSYLSTLFKKEVGMTLTDYVNKNRITYAKKLLKSTTLSIQDIAANSGIPDVHYFTRLFRREMGMSPREWRKTSAHSTFMQ